VAKAFNFSLVLVCVCGMVEINFDTISKKKEETLTLKI